MTIIIIVIKLSIIIYETKIEENEYDSESDNEFLNERKLKYINKKRSHSNNSDEENLTSRKEKLQSVSNKRFIILNIKTNIPTTYQQAINSPESEEWKEAIDDKLKNIYDNNVMKVVKNIPADANIIGTKWVFAEKDKKKKKARLVDRKSVV